ncbi:OmpA family protein [Photobacterium sp. SDRW27]|uniref:OmpA family protein n=1 Tax=Photobacterium obscurum TaxID=2829490 RepID=UPI0022449EB1|nr:OmpA family protein [Photobacterium obscurum]MCW8329386.1 OmpA family protein [Photobacterium obscurum]
MTCFNKRFSILTSLILSSYMLVGCGNGSDSVTSNAGKQSNTPIVPNAQILLTELPEMKQVVYFENNSFELDPNDQLLLDPLAVRLRQHPDSFLIVVGHSDNSGNEEEDIVLSYERAFSVAIYISSVFGIAEERIQLVAAGSSERLSTGTSEAERQQNHRVEILSPKAIVRTLSATQDQSY